MNDNTEILRDVVKHIDANLHLQILTSFDDAGARVSRILHLLELFRTIEWMADELQGVACAAGDGPLALYAGNLVEQTKAFQRLFNDERTRRLTESGRPATTPAEAVRAAGEPEELIFHSRYFDREARRED